MEKLKFELLGKNINGTVWPPTGFTMIGYERLTNIETLINEIMKNNIPGDFIETGVWRGGACIFMRAMLKEYGDTTRKVIVADSFEGLPKPNTIDYPEDEDDPHHTLDFLAVPLEEVKNNFKKFNLLDDQVVFKKGFFKDTLHHGGGGDIDQLALLRMDGDMYESTIQVLEGLYDKVVVGGFIIVDDYALLRARTAVHDFRQRRNITDEIIKIDKIGVYWRKSKQ